MQIRRSSSFPKNLIGFLGWIKQQQFAQTQAEAGEDRPPLGAPPPTSCDEESRPRRQGRGRPWSRESRCGSGATSLVPDWPWPRAPGAGLGRRTRREEPGEEAAAGAGAQHREAACGADRVLDQRPSRPPSLCARLLLTVLQTQALAAAGGRWAGGRRPGGRGRPVRGAAESTGAGTPCPWRTHSLW
jgi:hypothetical protein